VNKYGYEVLDPDILTHLPQGPLKGIVQRDGCGRN
jgi:hypothetical protein